MTISEKIYDDVKSFFINPNNHNKESFLISGNILIFFILHIINQKINIDILNNYKDLIISILMLLFSLLFLKNKYWVTSFKKKEYGVAICLKYETIKEKQHLKDYINKLQKIQKDSKKPISFLILKNYYSKKIIDEVSTLKNIQKINKKIKANLFISADIKKRQTENAEKYIIEFNSILHHEPVTRETQAILGIQLSHFFTKELKTDEMSIFDTLSSLSAETNRGIKYMLGIISNIKNDFENSLIFLEPIEDYFKSKQNKTDIDRVNYSVLRKVIAYNYHGIFIKQIEEDKKNVDIDLLNKSISYIPNNYDFLIAASFYSFEIENNLQKAREYNRQARDSNRRNDYHWAFNEIFFMLYEENYPAAIKKINKLEKKGFKLDINGVKATQEHTDELLQRNTENKQFLFWVGCINYLCESNDVFALNYLEKFIEETKNDYSYVRLQKKAEFYIRKIKDKMKLN